MYSVGRLYRTCPPLSPGVLALDVHLIVDFRDVCGKTALTSMLSYRQLCQATDIHGAAQSPPGPFLSRQFEGTRWLRLSHSLQPARSSCMGRLGPHLQAHDTSAGNPCKALCTLACSPFEPPFTSATAVFYCAVAAIIMHKTRTRCLRRPIVARLPARWEGIRLRESQGISQHVPRQTDDAGPSRRQDKTSCQRITSA
ncbi:hypothetical protein OH76DRAFT_358343 [Lentinus brumalis]|uniref:Uncharacterized protein n=1 Tax=Lentinus brumalis TaxID=2498619 RepID=A0A371CJE4_9APHY|nr:hypothetical protein OH76DRAFT_358343 [Polyporus brumalis]